MMEDWFWDGTDGIWGWFGGAVRLLCRAELLAQGKREAGDRDTPWTAVLDCDPSGCRAGPLQGAGTLELFPRENEEPGGGWGGELILGSSHF